MSLSVSKSLFREFCVSKPSSTSNAQLGNKFPALEGSSSRFASLNARSGACKDFSISPGFRALREGTELRVQHGNFWNG